MFFDSNYGYIELNQTDRPGSIGDSLAYTSQYITIAYVAGKLGDKINLFAFVSEKGPLRHPDSPWRENDTSGDQVYPLIAASALTQPVLSYRVIKQIKDAGYRTGNGDKIPPGMYGQIRRAQRKNALWVSDLPIFIQALFFKIPIRWSDSKKWFEKSEGSSSDYLNFINALAFAKAEDNITWPMKLAMKLIPKQKVLEKVKDYFKPEPNVQWLLDLYKEALEVIYHV